MTIRFLLVLAAVIALVVTGLALLADTWDLTTGLAVTDFALAAIALASVPAADRPL
jgi:Co/Zn/Cd efflux system component